MVEIFPMKVRYFPDAGVNSCFLIVGVIHLHRMSFRLQQMKTKRQMRIVRAFKSLMNGHNFPDSGFNSCCIIFCANQLYCQRRDTVISNAERISNNRHLKYLGTIIDYALKAMEATQIDYDGVHVDIFGNRLIRRFKLSICLSILTCNVFLEQKGSAFNKENSII